MIVFVRVLRNGAESARRSAARESTFIDQSSWVSDSRAAHFRSARRADDAARTIDRLRVNSRLFTLNDVAGPQIVGARFVGVIDCVQTRRIHPEHYYSDGATAFSNINGPHEIRQIAVAFEWIPCQPSGQVNVGAGLVAGKVPRVVPEQDFDLPRGVRRAGNTAGRADDIERHDRRMFLRRVRRKRKTRARRRRQVTALINKDAYGKEKRLGKKKVRKRMHRGEFT
ncbi:hypothetical protein [Achromobacter mucicolens]|uniref:hypothetical protein n=1 Tax=Achromobacter mucicolens TaxID=1389922 RepID=UPI0011B2374C|nr:hypothetical protein [Achromobacter mucicolens]